MMLPSVVAASSELAESLGADFLDDCAPSPAEPLVEILPSASKTDLLFACSWPWARKARKEPVGERTRFGSAFHTGMELGLGEQPHFPFEPQVIAEKWKVDVDELSDRVNEAVPIVKKWLGGDNMWGLTFTDLQLEVAVAYNPQTNEARSIEPPDEATHVYEGLQPNEIPGTADVVSVKEDGGRETTTVFHGPTKTQTVRPTKILLVLDHKSGWGVAADWQPQTPAESGQLRTLALGLARLHKADRVIVAYFHAPSGGVPVVMADMLSSKDLDAHRGELRKAQSRIGNGWLHPGPWCPTCPGWMICPTQTTTLIELKRQPGPLTAERVGAMHQAKGDFQRMAERLTEEMRAWVSLNGPAVRPDGQLVDLIPRKRTNLSQASINRALGPLKGGKEIDRLRKLGCITETENLELRATKR